MSPSGARPPSIVRQVTESLRAELARRTAAGESSLTMYQVRKGRAPERGITVAQATGVARRRGEAGLLPTMRVVSGGQVVEVVPRNAAARSTVGSYWAAVQRYNEMGFTGDWVSLDGRRHRGLRSFRGRSVGGAEYEADTDTLDALARTGELAVESIYAAEGTA